MPCHGALPSRHRAKRQIGLPVGHRRIMRALPHGAHCRAAGVPLCMAPARAASTAQARSALPAHRHHRTEFAHQRGGPPRHAAMATRSKVMSCAQIRRPSAAAPPMVPSRSRAAARPGTSVPMMCAEFGGPAPLRLTVSAGAQIGIAGQSGATPQSIVQRHGPGRDGPPASRPAAAGPPSTRPNAKLT